MSAYASGYAIPNMTPPEIPTGLAITSITETTLGLTWDESPRAMTFYLYRYYSSIDDFSLIYNGLVTSHLEDHLLPDTDYFFKVKAFNQYGWSDFSNIVSGRTNAYLTPPAPLSLKVINQTDESLEITWDESTGATSYTLYRYSEYVGDYIVIYSGTSNSFIHTELNSNTTYTYKVRAENNGVFSEDSVAVNGTTLGPPPPPSSITITNPTLNTLDVSWSAVTGATGYKLFNAIGLHRDYATSYFEVYSGADLSITVDNLRGGVYYAFKVAAYDQYGTGIKSPYTLGQTASGQQALIFSYNDSSNQIYFDEDVEAFRSTYYGGTSVITSIFNEWGEYEGCNFILSWISSIRTGTSTGALLYGFDREYSSTSCTVDVTTFGEVGDRIAGSFSAILTNGTSIFGVFDVIRKSDVE